MSTVDYRSKYGAWETNGIEDPDAYFAPGRRTRTVQLTDKQLKSITRLRLISDPGYPVWDVSHCHGVLKDGTEVRVSLPWQHFQKKQPLKPQLVRMCQDFKVYGKGLGLLDDSIISKCQ